LRREALLVDAVPDESSLLDICTDGVVADETTGRHPEIAPATLPRSLPNEYMINVFLETDLGSKA
jgi:hypothetical protein